MLGLIWARLSPREQEVAELAERGLFDYLVIESTGVCLAAPALTALQSVFLCLCSAIASLAHAKLKSGRWARRHQ